MLSRLKACIGGFVKQSFQTKGAGGSFCFFFLEDFCLERWGIGTLRTQDTKQPTMQRLNAM